MILSIFLFSIIGTLIYYLFQINTFVSFLILFLPLLLLFPVKKIEIKLIKFKKENLLTTFLGITILLFEVGIIKTILNNSTLEVTNSPWLSFNHWFFIAYLVATSLVIVFCFVSKNRITSLIAASLHLFTTYSVTVLFFPLGFGFDGFIHRATEVYIQANGFISPKQAVYVGQYNLVTWISNITGWSIFYVDSFLVPILASLSIPLFFSTILEKVWDIPRKYSINLIWTLPFIYFMSLHLTTPYNLVILLSLLTIFTTLGYIYEKIPFSIPLILSIAGLCTHILLGAPISAFVIMALLIKNTKKTKSRMAWYILYFFAISFLFSILFTIYILISGGDLPYLSNPLDKIWTFFELFKRPRWYFPTSSLIFETIYQWQRLIPILVIILSIAGFFLLRQKNKKHNLFIITALALCSGAFFLRSWIVFPDVATTEQGDYPMRLLKSSLMFVLPWAMFALYKITDQLVSFSNKYKTIIQYSIKTILVLGLAGALTISFYLAYPQENPKVHFPGYNVSISDFHAAEWIQNQNQQYDYIVLANPLTSVAAMTNYGFPKYFETDHGPLSYYSIPTGGVMYKLYQKMLYQGQKKETMLEAMEIMGVDKAYFVVSEFWAGSDRIVAGAKQTAEKIEIIDNGKIYIFTYTK